MGAGKNIKTSPLPLTSTPSTMFSSSASKLLRFTRPSLATSNTTSTIRTWARTSAIMGVTKTVLKEGDGAIPKVGDRVTIEYTGYLKDTSKPENKGDKFDSSMGRGAFVTEIGIGRVIKGWDEGVTTMKVGEMPHWTSPVTLRMATVVSQVTSQLRLILSSTLSFKRSTRGIQTGTFFSSRL